MSIFSSPLVADPVARVLSVVVRPSATSGLQLAEVPGIATEASIPTRHGTVRATVYHPYKSPNVRPPAHVNFHGGGFVIGHPEQDDPWCRYLAAHAGVVVVNPDYVLAPRLRFPAQVEQAYDIVRWASSSARHWDGTRLTVGGQSAGGNLSAAVARMAFANRVPRLSLQVLHYPVLDLVTATRHKSSPRGRRAVMRPWLGAVFDTTYAPDRAARRHPLASPAWGTNGAGLGGIAPALVIAAAYDRLRAEAASYARDLAEVGALVAYREIEGVDHGYNILGDRLDVTCEAYDFMVEHIRSATGQTRA